MLEPQKPELKVGTCLSDSVSAWASNLPVFFLASLVAIVLGLTGLYVATLTGLTLLILDAIEGRQVRLRSVFRPFRHPIRFIFLSSFSVVGLALWLAALVIVIVGVVPTTVFPAYVNAELDVIRNLFAKLLSAEVVAWLPAYQAPPHNWRVIAPILVLIGVIEL